MLRIVAIVILAVPLLSSCGFNRTEYDNLQAMRDEYLIRLSEIRQTNEIISRNIVGAYQELEVLRRRLDERNDQGRSN
ncbi:MAG: hypothetical protein LBE31_00645 [Deltaproteobacteria bacterium]|jgi:hypothetical protein|nr:hypothetical protein [Deltaproteobacteria bacterium]